MLSSSFLPSDSDESNTRIANEEKKERKLSAAKSDHHPVHHHHNNNNTINMNNNNNNSSGGSSISNHSNNDHNNSKKKKMMTPNNRTVVHFGVTVHHEGKKKEDGVEIGQTAKMQHKKKLFLRLKSSKEKYPVVSGFDRDPHGLPGQVEESGQVSPGDFLKSINGISLFNRSFQQCIAIIQKESQEEGSTELAFFRYDVIEVETLQWQSKSPVYGTYSKEILTAIRDRSDMDMNLAREFSKLGLPDEGGVRSVMWKVLLGYLTSDASTWEDSLSSSRASYQDLLHELISHPQCKENPKPIKRDSVRGRKLLFYPRSFQSETSHPSKPLFSPISLPSICNQSSQRLLSSLLEHSELDEAKDKDPETSLCDDHCSNQTLCFVSELPRCKIDDHPLSTQQGSAWKRYWDDWLLYESIEKDVLRTHPSLHFFAEGNGKHQAALQRILYLYAKLNPGIKYVQGMNELVGTLYYVFGNHMSYSPWREHAEADTFFCFSLLMSDVRDLFIRNLDDATCGIGGRIQDFVDTLFLMDPEVAQRLEEQGIAPSFYSLRWITTLFTREFDLFDTIRLWDSLFADSDKHDFLCFLCCAMVTELREGLLEGDFTANLTVLQHYPPVDISYFLSRVEQLRGQERFRTRRHQSGERARERAEVSSEVSSSQPLIGHLLSSFQDSHWISGVKQSLFSSHSASSPASVSVPGFEVCRGVEATSAGSSKRRLENIHPENSTLREEVIDFDDSPSVSSEVRSKQLLEDSPGDEDDEAVEEYEVMWEIGSPCVEVL